MSKPHRSSLAAYIDDPEELAGKVPLFHRLESFDNIDMDHLRVEFMRLSPTYACVDSASGTPASKLKIFGQLFATGRSNNWSKAESEVFKQRMNAVQTTNKEYGSINMPILDWYKIRGRHVFDNWANRRDVKLLGITHHPEGRDLSNPAVMDEAFHFLKSIATANDWPKTMLLAVPFDLPKKIAQQHVLTLLDAYYDWVLKIDDAEYRQRKELATQRERPDALVRKLKTMMCKAFHPELPLWKIGLIAKVSPSHNRRMNAKGVTIQEQIDMRPEIATLASRAIRQGQYIAEHAAMDVFPVSEKISVPTYDWNAVRERILLSYPNLQVSVA